MAQPALKLQLEGAEKARRKIAAKELALSTALRKASARSLFEGLREMKVMLSQPGTGRQYGSHRASAPGHPPAPQTGSYRNSWKIAVGADKFGGRLHTADARAPWLENGTRRMAARPHAGPVAEKMKSIWTKNAKEALRQ